MGIFSFEEAYVDETGAVWYCMCSLHCLFNFIHFYKIYNYHYIFCKKNCNENQQLNKELFKVWCNVVLFSEDGKMYFLFWQVCGARKNSCDLYWHGGSFYDNDGIQSGMVNKFPGLYLFKLKAMIDWIITKSINSSSLNGKQIIICLDFGFCWVSAHPNGWSSLNDKRHLTDSWLNDFMTTCMPIKWIMQNILIFLRLLVKSLEKSVQVQLHVGQTTVQGTMSSCCNAITCNL